MSEARKIDLVLVSSAFAASLLVLCADLTLTDIAGFLARLVP